MGGSFSLLSGEAIEKERHRGAVLRSGAVGLLLGGLQGGSWVSCMGHLIPMNLQLNAEVGDKGGAVKGDIVPSSGRTAAGAGEWPASYMNGLQCHGGLGGSRGCHLALCPALRGPATKASLIPIPS